MQKNSAANSYMKTKILTASPQELRLMLFDGAIKFCHQAKLAMQKEDAEACHDGLMRAQKILLELSTSLNHEVAPENCEKLAAIYIYIYRLLVDANMKKDEKLIDEARKLIKYEKETWQLLMDKVVQDGGADDSGPTDVSGAQQTAISSFSRDA